MPKIQLKARCAAMVDNPRFYEAFASPNTTLTDFMVSLAISDPFIKDYIFDPLAKRMYPYHLLIVDKKILLPNEMDHFIIGNKDLSIEVLPFVSGG